MTKALSEPALILCFSFSLPSGHYAVGIRLRARCLTQRTSDECATLDGQSSANWSIDFSAMRIDGAGMSDGQAALAGMALSFVICLLWFWSARGRPQFGRWWQATGIVAFIGLSILLFALFSRH